MKMRVYLPENLELEQLVRENPPKIGAFKEDKAKFILHLINALAMTAKDSLSEKYTKINARTLQGIIKDYNKYLDYLIEGIEVVESNNHYMVGFDSKGFRFRNKFRTKVKPDMISDFTLTQNLRRGEIKKEKSVLKLNYLTKWFNDKLEIDVEKATLFVNREYELKKENLQLCDYNPVKKKHKIPLNQLNHAIISIDKIKQSDYSKSVDNNTRRFHSNLTNMRSILRNAITYDGEKLISIDIKNSQPYLSLVLFNKEFWLKRKEKEENIINSNKLHISNINIKYNQYYIMIGDIAESLDDKGLQLYKDLVSKGVLYEYIQSHLKSDNRLKFSSRRDVKSTVFQTLYSDNRFIGQVEAKPKRDFRELFPDVYALFAVIKKKDHTLLPRLLQNIESHLIIKVISKRIGKELPLAPIFTIHDSIATTSKYVEAVEKIMHEELESAIGFAPSLKRECWDSKNIDDYLKNLEEKAKKYN